MRLSRLFGRTLRQPPMISDPITELALKASLIHLVDDQLVLLPLAERVLTRMQQSLLSNMPTTQKLVLPPGYVDSYWIGTLQGVIQSYRQLPATLHAKRLLRSHGPPHGLARPLWSSAFQWMMVTTAKEELVDAEERWIDNIEAWLPTADLAPQRLEWQPGTQGWVVLHETGPESILTCPECGYAASMEAAQFQRSSHTSEALEEIESVPTPGADTIRSLAEMLSIPESKTLKAVFLTADDGHLFFVVLQGDLEISLSKLAHATGRRSFRPADEEEILAAEAEPGYASPIGLKVQVDTSSEGVFVVGDLSIERGSNFVAGANRPGYHLKGVNYPRDFSVTLMADIACASENDECLQCGMSLVAKRGIYLGGWQQLADSIRYANDEGRDQDSFVGLGTLLFEPLLAAIIAIHSDDQGLVWPATMAPFDVHLVDLRCSEDAATVVQELESIGIHVLYDDRDVSPGVKFVDADLIGCPIRITVSQRSMKKGGVEISMRGDDESKIIPIENLQNVLQIP
jgi:prolyl-tRNA synthetase